MAGLRPGSDLVRVARYCGRLVALRRDGLIVDDMFPQATPDDIRLEDKVAELERELALRRRLYPIWVNSGKIQRHAAHRQIITLEAILADYRRKEATS